MKYIKFFFIIFITFSSSIKADLNQELSLEIKKGGKLIFIRHINFCILYVNKLRQYIYKGIIYE